VTADLLYTPATELCRLLAARELSPAELTGALLRRIEEANGALNAIVALRAEEALAEQPGDGPLAGLPITVKELNETPELPTTYCSRAFAGAFSGFEALVVTRLKRAGAIVVGKTNSPG
jgi:Asp-tRNA(Asn)/Glu-tRNA(Gln) amidotransferase A subunit family amidase